MRSSLAWLACGQPPTETHPAPIGECHGELGDDPILRTFIDIAAFFPSQVSPF